MKYIYRNHLCFFHLSINWSNFNDLPYYIISLSLNIVKTMLDSNQQYRYFTTILNEKSEQVNNEAFQQRLCIWLQHEKPTRGTLNVIYKGIFVYGFGFLFSLKPHYQSEYFKINVASLKSQLILIELLVNKFFGIFGFDNFIGLEFLKQNPIQEIRKLRKMQKKMQFSLQLSKQLMERSVKCIRHSLSLKKLIYKVDQMSSLNANTLKNIYNNLKLECLHLEEYNYFQRSYHFFILGKFLEALVGCKSKLALDKKSVERIDEIITEMIQIDKLFSFQKGQKCQSSKNSNKTLKLYSSSKKKEIQVLDVKEEQIYSNTQDISSTNINLQTKLNTRSNSVYSRLLIGSKNKVTETPTSKNVKDHQQKSKKKPLHNFMCCRQFFYIDEIIDQAESLRRQYKFYTFPFDCRHIFILCKTIVAFLNCQGGIIYLGIKEQENKMRRAVGIDLNEQTKEQLLKSIRKICERIEPDIVSSTLYQVKFVPMKSTKNNKFVSKKYIVKIIVQMGKPKELYFSRTKDEGIKVAFRTENQVLVKDPSNDLGKIIEIVKNRLLDPPRIAGIDHQGPCREPEMGLSCYQ